VVEKGLDANAPCTLFIMMLFLNDMRKRRLCGFLCLLSMALILILVSCSKSTKPEPLVNRVYLPEQLEAVGGHLFSVPVSFENEAAVSAIYVPLLFPSDIMRFDSISFHGSRVGHFDFKMIDVTGDTILFGVLGVIDDTVSVNPGRGLLVTLHFWMHGNAPETTFVFNTFDSWRWPISFFDSNLRRLPTPLFKPCQVHVQGITLSPYKG
jgi:hypothetical protein